MLLRSWCDYQKAKLDAVYQSLFFDCSDAEVKRVIPVDIGPDSLPLGALKILG
ncbi:hypothetical protein [secondary endosymbiont of Ctenarytaina eucalypti]|uniref:hypothetical protein n=1 Tax=secondary endosymbiont of Ctenarytaina eucalypti TaxID=1199245 RepID=UPI0002EDD17B|nr:hypothetical protein [secondary endosymbiont of Ctenarytaina eucalypti]